MHGPDGRIYPNLVRYIEVKEPELLRYLHAGEEETEDIRFQVVVRLEEEGTMTRVTMHTEFESPEILERVIREFGAREGMEQTMTRLADLLQSA